MGRIITPTEVYVQLGIDVPTGQEEAIVASSITSAEGAIRRHLKYDPVQASRTEYYPQLDFTLLSRASLWEVSETQAYIRRLSDYVTNEIQVQHLPIRTITSLKVDYDGRSGTREGSFGDETLLVEGVDFWPNYDMLDSDGASVGNDGIIRSHGRWPTLAGSVELIYVAGYTSGELAGTDTIIDASPISDATMDETVRRVHKTFSRMKQSSVGFGGGALESEKLGDYAYKRNAVITQQLVGTSWDILPETAEKLEYFIRMDQGVM